MGYGFPAQEEVDGAVWQHHLIILEALSVQTEPLDLARWSLPWTPHQEEPECHQHQIQRGVSFFFILVSEHFEA